MFFFRFSGSYRLDGLGIPDLEPFFLCLGGSPDRGIQGIDPLCVGQIGGDALDLIPYKLLGAADHHFCVGDLLRIGGQIVHQQDVRQLPGKQILVLGVVQPDSFQICRVIPHIDLLAQMQNGFLRIHVPDLFPGKGDVHAVSLDLLGSGGSHQHEIQLCVRRLADRPDLLVPDIQTAHAPVLCLRAAVLLQVVFAVDPCFQMASDLVVLRYGFVLDSPFQAFRTFQNRAAAETAERFGKLALDRVKVRSIGFAFAFRTMALCISMPSRCKMVGGSVTS